MKTIKMTDKLHTKLTAIVGELIAESGQIKTYEDAIEALVHRSVVLPPEFVQEMEAFIENNKEFGFSTKEEFFKTAERWLMNHLKNEHLLSVIQPTTANEAFVSRGEQLG